MLDICQLGPGGKNTDHQTWQWSLTALTVSWIFRTHRLGIQEDFLQEVTFHIDLSLQVGEDSLFKYQFICLLILKLFVERLETVGDC